MLWVRGWMLPNENFRWSRGIKKVPFTLRSVFGTARIKQAPGNILSVLRLPTYTVQVRIKIGTGA